MLPRVIVGWLTGYRSVQQAWLSVGDDTPRLFDTCFGAVPVGVNPFLQRSEMRG